MSTLNVNDMDSIGAKLKQIQKLSAYFKGHSTIVSANNPFFPFEINSMCRGHLLSDVGDLINRCNCQGQQIGINYSVVRLGWGGVAG